MTTGPRRPGRQRLKTAVLVGLFCVWTLPPATKQGASQPMFYRFRRSSKLGRSRRNLRPGTRSLRDTPVDEAVRRDTLVVARLGFATRKPSTLHGPPRVFPPQGCVT